MFKENAPFQFLQSRRGDMKTTPLSREEGEKVAERVKGKTPTTNEHEWTQMLRRRKRRDEEG
jgi:hypothetical protein